MTELLLHAAPMLHLSVPGGGADQVRAGEFGVEADVPSVAGKLTSNQMLLSSSAFARIVSGVSLCFSRTREFLAFHISQRPKG